MDVISICFCNGTSFLFCYIIWGGRCASTELVLDGVSTVRLLPLLTVLLVDWPEICPVSVCLFMTE